MNRLAAIPSQNGVIKIARKGSQKFQLGDGADAPTASVDVIATLNEFYEQAGVFFDENDEVPKDQRRAYNAMTDEFVARVFETDTITHAEALEFISLLQQEQEKLKRFFDASSRGGQSSPENTEPPSS